MTPRHIRPSSKRSRTRQSAAARAVKWRVCSFNALDIANTAVVGFNESCLLIDHDATWSQADSGNLTLEAVHLNCSTAFDAGDKQADLEDLFAATDSNSNGVAELANPFDQASPDFSLAAQSLSTIDTTTLGSFFESASFVGAIDGDDWTAGWTTNARN